MTFKGSSVRVEMNITSLPDDLLGRIFEELHMKERCRVVPLVSRHFRHIHQEFPSRCKSWTIHESCDETLIKQLATTAPWIEELRVLHDSRSNVAQLLDAVAHAPHLRILDLEEKVEPPVLASLAALTTLRELELRWLSLPDIRGPELVECLIGLRSLEIIRLAIVTFGDFNAFMEQTEGLWRALASLSHLHTVQLSVTICDRTFDGLHIPPFSGISQLTQIRTLIIAESIDPFFEGGHLLEGVSRLTALTEFGSSAPLRFPAYQPVLSLPRLERLTIEIDSFGDEGDLVDPLPRMSPHLTALTVNGDSGGASFRKMLPLLPSSLRNLTLRSEALPPIPELAKRMPCLSHITLRATDLARLPPHLEQLTALESLEIDSLMDCYLRLEPSDVEVIAGLRCLHTLVIRTSPPERIRRITGNSIPVADITESVLANIRRHCPNVKVLYDQ